MRDYATLDLETDPFSRPDPRQPGRIPEAFAAGLFDGKRCAIWWGEFCAAESIRHLVKHGQDLLVYAHNGGKFDFHFLLSEILKHFAADDLEIMAIG